MAASCSRGSPTAGPEWCRAVGAHPQGCVIRVGAHRVIGAMGAGVGDDGVMSTDLPVADIDSVGCIDGDLICVSEMLDTDTVMFDVANGEYGEADIGDIAWAADQRLAHRVFCQQWRAATGSVYQLRGGRKQQ